MVMLLTVLAVIGGFSLAQMSSIKQPGVSLAGAVLVNSELRESRQALMSYTTLYPYLYGPRGAGVGHLPCPDSDSLDVTASNWSVKHGPNPPCGNGIVAQGHLPQHISFPTGRYMIHAAHGPRVDYAVSTQVVNNPANQAVNPALMLHAGKDQTYVALLQRSIGTHSSKLLQSSEVIVTKKALLQAARYGVAAWLADKINDQTNSTCDLDRIAYRPEKVQKPDEECHRLRRIIQQCRVAHSGDNGWRVRPGKFSSIIVLLMLADIVPERFQCALAVVEQLRIDKVPATVHWLLRNDWLDWIVIVYDAQCVQANPARCKATVDTPGIHEAVAESLVLRWMPT